MTRKATFRLPLLAALLVGLAVAGAALAQTSPSYNLVWHIVGGSGGPLTSSSYRVNGTVGQSASSPPYSGSASYRVSGGYWYEAIREAAFEPVYLPIVQRR